MERQTGSSGFFQGRLNRALAGVELCEHSLRLLTVVGHLRLQGLDAPEFSIRADETDELDGNLVSVQFADEIEEIDFKDWHAVVERGTGAEIGGALQLSFAQIGVYGVNAVCKGGALGEGDVGGRIAEIRSAFGAANDFACDAPWPAEVVGGARDVSLCQLEAYGG